MFSIGFLQKVWFGVHVTASERFLDLALHYSRLVVLYTLIVLYTHGEHFLKFCATLPIVGISN
jgi:hypothetical protein